jgi:hypothetical protein
VEEMDEGTRKSIGICSVFMKSLSAKTSPTRGASRYDESSLNAAFADAERPRNSRGETDAAFATLAEEVDAPKSFACAGWAANKAG